MSDAYATVMATLHAEMEQATSVEQVISYQLSMMTALLARQNELLEQLCGNQGALAPAQRGASPSDRLARCPSCGHDGIADSSPHVYFAENRLALRCRSCGHVWRADRT